MMISETFLEGLHPVITLNEVGLVGEYLLLKIKLFWSNIITTIIMCVVLDHLSDVLFSIEVLIQAV